MEKGHAVSAVTINNAKIFSQLMSKTRSLAKISERRLQPLLVWGITEWKLGFSILLQGQRGGGGMAPRSPCVRLWTSIYRVAADSKSASSLRSLYTSVTVSFSVHNNLKITSVIYLFYLQHYRSCCSHSTIHEHRPRANAFSNCDCTRAVNNIVTKQWHFAIEQR